MVPSLPLQQEAVAVTTVAVVGVVATASQRV
jgi:hypothetical protein